MVIKGLFFTFFYVGSYARNILHVSYEDSINLLLTVSHFPKLLPATI
jgi:hypothetical protein